MKIQTFQIALTQERFKLLADPADVVLSVKDSHHWTAAKLFKTKKFKS